MSSSQAALDVQLNSKTKFSCWDIFKPIPFACNHSQRSLWKSPPSPTHWGVCNRVQWFSLITLLHVIFWFGLEILTLVYKKAIFKILNGFYLIWPFNFKKIAPPLIRVEKKFFKIGRRGYQKKRNFVLISKMCRTLATRISKDFFSENRFFLNFPSPKKSVFL